MNLINHLFPTESKGLPRLTYFCNFTFLPKSILRPSLSHYGNVREVFAIGSPYSSFPMFPLQMLF